MQKIGEKRPGANGKTTPSPKAAPAAAAAAGSEKARFLSRVHQDWASPKLRSFIRASATAPGETSTLKLRNQFCLLGSSGLAADLEEFASVLRLRRAEEAGPLSERADVLLIEGAWPRSGDPWRQALLNTSEEAATRLYRVIRAFRERGVPVVLWITDELETAQAFAHLFEHVDVVFGPEGSDFGQVLAPAVNIKRFNPFKSSMYKFRGDAPFFRFLVDGAYELAQHYEASDALRLLQPLLRYNSWLIDSSYSTRNNNDKISPVLRRRFAGCLDERETALMFRYASAVFYPESYVRQRPGAFRKRALQAAASKALTFTNAPIEDGVFARSTGDSARFSALLETMVEDAIGLMANQHLAWRGAVGEHSYFERCETILRAVGIRPVYNRSPSPSVNFVMPTIRPELIPYTLAMFEAQVHPNKHLTIVINGSSIPDDVRRMVEATPDVKLCFVPSSKSIGYCMNYGIDQADTAYWAKIDDDDIYGPHFVSDMLLQAKYLDFDVCGKGAIFTYLEEGDALHIRRPDNADTLETYVGGGTLLVRNDGRVFPEDVRGYADTMFLLNRSEAGDRIVAGDPFNFVQVRRSDAASHTWTAGAHTLNLKGPTRAGLRLQHVLI